MHARARTLSCAPARPPCSPVNPGPDKGAIFEPSSVMRLYSYVMFISSCSSAVVFSVLAICAGACAAVRACLPPSMCRKETYMATSTIHLYERHLDGHFHKGVAFSALDPHSCSRRE